MKKFQKLSDPLFRDNSLNSDQMKKMYGGSGPTKVTGISADCSTHTANPGGGGHNNDGCDSTTDTGYINDPPAEP